MFACIWSCMGRAMGGWWMWVVGFALVAAIIVGLSTMNPWAGAAVAAAILVGWALVVFLNCFIACTRR
jgi:hypothetical protein